MKYLFLRGHVPNDRDPKEIIFDNLNDCDDMWTQLFFKMLKKDDYGEIWYLDGNRNHKFADNFCERWINQKNLPDFKPDIVFCRGGFPSYVPILNRLPNSYKVYYGAGQRFIPTDGYYNYNLILTDSENQLKTVKSKFPNIKSSLFIKPAADNLFLREHNIEKEYDIVFPANGSQENLKGHSFVFSLPSKYKILNLGNNGKINVPKHIERKRVLRKDMNFWLQKAKIGICCSDSTTDSCPRVVPEMLASGLPIVCLDSVRFWNEKYINNMTGKISSKSKFIETINEVLDNYTKYNSREYYKNNLSLGHAAKFINNLIEKRTL